MVNGFLIKSLEQIHLEEWEKDQCIKKISVYKQFEWHEHHNSLHKIW